MIGVIFWLCALGIIYVYAGYPVLLFLLAQLRPKPKLYAPLHTPSVTVLIAAHNEQAVIAQKLENTLALDYPRERTQIIVAADGSDDRTPEIVREFAARDVELSYSPPRRGKAAAINRALPIARGEVVVFSDANNFYEREAVRNLVAPLSDPAVGAVTGAKRIARGGGALAESEGLYWKYESFIKKQETRLGSCLGTAGEILAVRRSLIEPLPETVINDDFYIASRVVRRGFRVVYAPEARSFESASASAGDEQMRRARIVAGRYQALALGGRLLPFKDPLALWQVVSHKFMRPLVPLLMAGALAAAAAAVLFPSGGESWLALAPPHNWSMLAMQVAFYLLAWIGSRRQRAGAAGRLFYLPAYLVSSNIAAIVGLYRYLSGSQSHVWRRARRPDAAGIARTGGRSQ